MTSAGQVRAAPFRRVRPGDAAWPTDADWSALSRAVGGRLKRLQAPLAACGAAPDSAACRDALAALRSPFALGDDPALTQSSGWADAWVSAPSAYAVAARTATDVAAAVDFARRHRLRLVVKGGGHSYQGTSNAAGSLLVWTRPMREAALHDAFQASGCSGEAGQPAVSLGAGALWLDAYHAVTTKGGRYVQGGGCTTVGVAGLIQSGGFGSFSKRYGLAAGSLLEAEIVTADGQIRIANRCTHPDLFWALKGGGGGTLGVVTRLTLKTHALPATFGAVLARVQATSDEAYVRLIAHFTAFYADRLLNPHWGEQARFGPDNSLRIAMVFQGLGQAEAQSTWQPLLDWVARVPQDYTLPEPFRFLALPARHMWDAAWLHRNAPGLVVLDDRPNAPAGNFAWAGDVGQAGQFMHGFDSRWLPASLLVAATRARLVEALFRATRHWPVSLHFNKGLAGAPAEAVAAARDAAIHPSAAEAFALAISAAEGPPAYPGLPGTPPDLSTARARAGRIKAAMGELREVAPEAGSYVSEGDFFEAAWQSAFWGSHYARLLAVKRRYDPDGLFFVHHGAGSEGWSADGFARL